MTSTFAYPTSTSSPNRQMGEVHNHNQILGGLIGLSISPQGESMRNNGSIQYPPPISLETISNSNENFQQALTSHQLKIAANPIRTPLSLLNEICLKAGTNAHFEIISEGPVHKPAFDCLVKVERDTFRWEARGRGCSKKDAKQEAARALLHSMDERAEKILQPPVPKTVRPESPEPDVDPDVIGNPVGELNDLCMRVKLPPPIYESVGEEGKPHNKAYFVQCTLTGKVREIGKGRNKKHAKRVAANVVLKILTDTWKSSGDMSTIFTPDELEQRKETMTKLHASCAKYFTDVSKVVRAPTCAADLVFNMIAMSGPKIESLDKMSQQDLVKSDVLQLLKDISEEQGLKVELMDLGVQAEEPRHRYLIYCESNPVLVRIGVGSNPTLAKKAGAHEVLEFLRIIRHK